MDYIEKLFSSENITKYLYYLYPTLLLIIDILFRDKIKSFIENKRINRRTKKKDKTIEYRMHIINLQLNDFRRLKGENIVSRIDMKNLLIWLGIIILSTVNRDIFSFVSEKNTFTSIMYVTIIWLPILITHTLSMYTRESIRLADRRDQVLFNTAYIEGIDNIDKIMEELDRFDEKYFKISNCDKEGVRDKLKDYYIKRFNKYNSEGTLN